jgi:pSer/pThr/pTyr-binding forkhead associated (FHA) protein
MRSWIIGSAADCDLVVAKPSVAGRHCRLTEVAGGYLVEDLSAKIGTYVNGSRISAPTRVSTSDKITLGTTVPMPWPAGSTAAASQILRIGRSLDNDIVIDDPRVSGHHARLIVSHSQTLIQDVGSSTGTFVNSAEQNATLALPLGEKDFVFLGSLKVPAAQLLPPKPKQERPLASPPPSKPPAEVAQDVEASSTSRRPSLRRATLALLAQPLVLAALIASTCGRQAGALLSANKSDPLGWSVAATTFALGLAAIWSGGCLAVWNAAAARSFRGPSGSIARALVAGLRLFLVVAWSAAQCAVLLLVVRWARGLRGDWFWMFGALLLGSAVALSFGLVVTGLVRSPTAASGVLIVSFVPIVALGGWVWPLPQLHPIARTAAAMMPSRWAFEGLLLLESAPDQTPPDAERQKPDRNQDLAEEYFPADSERMGPEADAIALASMLITFCSLAAVVSGRSKPTP